MKSSLEIHKKSLAFVNKYHSHNHDFSCMHCHLPVSASMLISKVHNRNHCPYCLWSRHLDLFKPGDRLSACKAEMRPIGLAFKRERNRYAPSLGELMIVHQCSDCGKFSLNRSAADDDPALIISLLELSRFLTSEMVTHLEQEGIQLISSDRARDVHRQLEGALSFQC
jgi:DNA-directed RNA polymerase subunit RPC12/RpoP